MQATKQIRLLLEHLNRKQSDPEKLRRDLGRFIKGFDGSERAGFIEVVPDTRPAWLLKAEAWTDDTLLAALRTVLLKGFGDGGLGDVGFAPGDLTFNVRSVTRPRLKGARAERAYRDSPGVYVVQVSGPRAELVIFLLMHLLTRPGLARLHKCRRDGCDQLFVTEPVKGRPSEFCSPECREMNRAVEKLNQRGRRK